MPFPETFTTTRLTAERLRSQHFAAIRAMDSDPAYMALLGGPRSALGTRGYMARNLQHWDDYGFGLWILRDSADEVELGYGFHTKYWGQGLATEIATELLRLGRHELGLPTLVAITTAANLGSQRVLIKAGLVYERDIDHEGVPHQLY